MADFYVTERVTISEIALNRMMVPGGMIYEFNEDFAAAVRERARRGAPRRTGALAASVTSRPGRGNQYVSRFIVGASVDYASFVHEGTGPQSAYGKVFYQASKRTNLLPGAAVGAKNWKSWIGKLAVGGAFSDGMIDGQDAQPFLVEALRFEMAKLATGRG